MRLLLDTCTFLWFTQDRTSLSDIARDALTDMDNVVFMSAVTAWEISIKYRRGRLPLPLPPAQFLQDRRVRYGFKPLAVDENAAFHAATLPVIHKDPFDRMLVCQAMQESLTLVTPDPNIRKYAVNTLW